jgi:putative PIN family toxin of toxin-antitoxin system
VTRIVVDTNIWVSAFLAPDGHCGRLVRRLLADRELEIVISATLLEELLDVLSRPRLLRRYAFEPDEVRDYAATLWAGAVVPCS